MEREFFFLPESNVSGVLVTTCRIGMYMYHYTPGLIQAQDTDRIDVCCRQSITGSMQNFTYSFVFFLTKKKEKNMIRCPLMC